VDSCRVVALHLKPSSGGLSPASQLELVAGKGIVGDKCYGRRHRQVLLVSTSNLNELGLAPGELREQVTVELPELQQLPVGTIVAVGDVELEIEQDCTPCSRMAERLGETPEEFIARSSRKRGMLVKVRKGGLVLVGDLVRVVEGCA